MGFGDIFKIKQFKSEIERLTAENQALFSDNSSMHQKMSELGIYDYLKIKEMISSLEKEYAQKEEDLKNNISLFQDKNKERARKLDHAMDDIRSRYGWDKVKRGSTFQNSFEIGKKYRAQFETKKG